MRRQSAPTGLRLAIFLLFAANLKSSSSQNQQIDYSAKQEHLVCKKPDSQLCVTWHLGPVDPDIIIEESPSNATQFCGLSDLKRILPHRKFITVKSLARGGNSKVVFCKGFTKLKGEIVDWNQVEKTLNALSRSRRQAAFMPRGRYRGQTQSQYLAIDRGNGKDEGKAEAHSAADSSRASVSGNSGMGQAQSQSIYDPNCDDCYEKSDQEAESLKRGSYIPGSSGNRYAPTDNYGTTGGYKPGQGSAHQPNVGYGPERNGGFGPGYSLGSGTGVTGGGPNSQMGGGNVGYTPGQESRPGNYGQSSGMTPDGSLGRNGGFGPGLGSRPGSVYGPSGTIPGNQGANGGYRPVQEMGPGSAYGPSGRTPGGSQGVNVGYVPGQGNGPGSGYGPSSGKTPGSSQGVNGGYVPGQGNTPGTGYGIPTGTTPGVNQGASGGFMPGQGNGQGTGYRPPSGTRSDVNQGPNAGYRPGQGSGTSTGYRPGQGSVTGSGYGPPSGTILSGNQGPNGGYGPGQGSGTGSGYGPSRTTPSVNQGANGGYGPGQRSGTGSGYGPSKTTPGANQGANGGYGPSQGSGTGSGYGPSRTIPGVNQAANGGYGPGQGSGTGSGYGPSRTTPGVNQGANGGYGPGQGSGTGNVGFGPSLETTPGSQGGNGGYGPGGQHGGNGLYGPEQGQTRPIIGGYGPNQFGGQNTGYAPTQNSGGRGTYENRPGWIGQGVSPGNQQSRTPDGNIYPSQERQPGTYSPGQSNLPGGTYNPIQNTYPPNQGPVAGYGPGSSPGQLNGPSTSGTNWPLATGPYPGPGGTTVYCCTVPNNFGQNIKTNGNIIPSTGTGYPYGTEQRGTDKSDISSNLYGPGITGPANLQGQQGSNNLQSPGPYSKELNTGPYGNGNINGPSKPPNNEIIGRPDIYGTGSSGRPGSQNGNFGTGPSRGPTSPSNIFGQRNYDHLTTVGTEGQNGIQMPGSYDTGTGGSGGPHAMQGSGSYNTGNYGDPRKQYDLQQPGTSGGIETQNGLPVPVGNNDQSGGQNVMQGIGNYGVGPTVGPGGQNGIQGIGSFGSVPSGGFGNQNGLKGPGISGTNVPGLSGDPNSMQTPENYGSFVDPSRTSNQGSRIYIPGSSGGPGIQHGLGGTGTYGIPIEAGSHNGFQRPDSYGVDNGGPGGQNSNQGPGIYGTGIPGGPGGQSSNQRPGLYGTGTPGGPGVQIGIEGTGPVGQNGLQRPGSDGLGTFIGPNTEIGMPGVGSYGQNLPSNEVGGRENIGTIGGPGAYGGQNGNAMPGSELPGEYPGVYGQQPQGTLGQGSTSQGFNNQGNSLLGNEYNGIPQNYVNPNSITNDGDDSEAEAIVNQAANGTTASASSKGGNDKGRAQTHVHGTYTGGGSFEAQAQITGEHKEAESEVSGGKKGASSSATGSGRNNKSQASVQLGSETGSIQTQSQSNGAMHSSNSQVQGSVKGGMADAQAKGPGSTSSQAQIGFTPYKDGDKIHESFVTPFVGGGVASAQSSGRTGQSQSQLHGTFKYGITYSGAAQSGASLDKDAIFPNRLNFEKINVFDENQKNINVNSEVPEIQTPSTESTLLPEVPIETKRNTSIEDEVTTEIPRDETMKNSESRYLSHTHLDHHKFDTTPIPSTATGGSRRSFQTGYENVGSDYEYTTDKDEIPPEEYDTDPGYGVEGNDATDIEQAVGEEFPNYDEYSRDYQTHQSLQSPQRKGIEVQQTTGGSTQHIVLGSLNNHDAEITQRNSERPDESKVYLPGERVPGTGGYRIPIGFTGSVKSVASKEKTYVVGSKHSPSQAQTVTLTPGTGKVKYVYPPSNGKYVKPKDLRSLQRETPKDDRYVSVSKSVTRALDGEDNIRKQYSHTYYTKSSSCGYFTFTCTMVSGVDGKKKVCKPKIPTNPDGTPIRC